MKNKHVRKILSFVFIVTIFSLSFCCAVKASEYETTLCEFTEEYIEWMKLSDEEKLNVVKPPACDFEATENNRLKTSIKETFTAFNNVKLPSKFDIREQDYKIDIKNQRQTGQCWAFASLSAVEIFAKISKEINETYSPRHMEYATSRVFKNGEINDWGFNRSVGNGGHVLHSSAYLTSQVGPVLESEMPFENNEELIEISKIQNKSKVLDVNEVTIGGLNSYSACTSGMISNIKNQIVKYGSVVSSAYMTDNSTYYNSSTGALHYGNTALPNHAILIVGWDDSYSTSNFPSTSRPTSNGAWIIQNSYGTTFGDGGYNYISYEDTRICTLLMSVNEVDTEVEDNAYIHDRLGYEYALGYKDLSGNPILTGYGMAVYTKSNSTELLKEVTIGAIGEGDYKIYYMAGDASKTSVANMTEIGSGEVTHAGYLTHKLENPVLIDYDDEEFSIAVKWTLDSNSNPIPISTTTSADYFFLDIQPGQTFYSHAGSNWTDAYNSNYVVSIKAFTNDVTYSLSSNVTSVKEGDSSNILVDLALTSKNIDVKDLNIVIKDSKDDFIDKFNVTYDVDDSGNPTTAVIDFYNSLDNGTYYASIYYQNNYIETISFNVAFGIVSNVYSISASEKSIYINSPTLVSTFLSNITGQKGTITKDGNAVATGYVGTGMVIDDYTIVLKGDVTGDGLIKVNDIMKISKYTVEGTGLESTWYWKAADVTGDSLIKVNDVMKISKYTIEGGSL